MPWIRPGATACAASRYPQAPAQAYFAGLLSRQRGTVVDRNVYWLSHPAGRTNWPKTLGQPPGTLSQYVNLQALKTPPASVTATAAATTHRGGPDGAGLAATVTITSTSAAPAVGFVLRADVPWGTAAGTELAGDSELQSLIWKRQRDHALARRVAGTDRYLQPGRSRRPCHQRFGMEQAEDRHRGTGTVTCPAREQQTRLPQCDGAEAGPHK